MNSKTIQNLQHFVGKVCSIVSKSMNRSFDEIISREHFVVRIQSINSDGVWGTHPYNDELISFFSFPHIISIHQEVELDPENPQHQQMIKEYEEKTGKKIKPDIIKNNIEKKELLPILEQKKSPVPEKNTGDLNFVDISNLENLAAQSKKTFDAEDYLTK
jgi:hypothetical protein